MTGSVAYQVAVTPEGLDSAPVVEASSIAEAASRYVADQGLAPGTYCVRQVGIVHDVIVRVRRVIEATSKDNGSDAEWREERTDG